MVCILEFHKQFVYVMLTFYKKFDYTIIIQMKMRKLYLFLKLYTHGRAKTVSDAQLFFIIYSASYMFGYCFNAWTNLFGIGANASNQKNKSINLCESFTFMLLFYKKIIDIKKYFKQLTTRFISHHSNCSTSIQYKYFTH